MSGKKFFRCALPIDDSAADVTRPCQGQGLLCADHTLPSKNHGIAVLSKSKIALLKQAGIRVDVLDRPANETPGRTDATAGALGTGCPSRIT